MVCKWAMSDRFGPRTFGANEEHLFLGREISRSRDFSEKTAEAIDEEVDRLLREAHGRAKELLSSHADRVRMLVDLLLERETVDGRIAESIVRDGVVPQEAAAGDARPAGEDGATPPPQPPAPPDDGGTPPQGPGPASVP